MHRTQLLYPLTDWWTFGSFPGPGRGGEELSEPVFPAPVDVELTLERRGFERAGPLTRGSQT